VTNILNQREGQEVLTPSYLEKYTWPELDPNTVDQPVKLWTPEAAAAVARAAANFPLNPEHFLKQTAAMPVHRKLLWLFGHDAFNFNGTTRVREDAQNIARLEKLVAAGEPIPIPFPVFCAIPSPAKQITRPGVTAGERASIHFFMELDALARQVYAPGIRIHILSDTALYNSALQNSPAAAAAYLAGLRQLVVDLGAAHCVTVHDYASLLAPYAGEFDRHYNAFYLRLLAGDPTVLPREELANIFRSVRASINTERLGLSYQDIRAVFGPDRGEGHPLAATVDNMAKAALLDQVSVRLACGVIDLPERLWPGHIRASVHKGLKSGVAILGLRVHPEYYHRSHLLPYHGKPWIRPDGRMIVEPEFALRSRPELTRIVNEAGQSLLYIA
jgi:hypothetical protein